MKKFLKLAVVGSALSIVSFIVMQIVVDYIVNMDLNTVKNPNFWIWAFYISLTVLALFVLFAISMAIGYFIARHKEIKNYGKKYYRRL